MGLMGDLGTPDVAGRLCKVLDEVSPRISITKKYPSSLCLLSLYSLHLEFES